MRVKFPVVDEKIVFGARAPLGEEALRRHFASLVRKSIAEIDAQNDRLVGQNVEYHTTVDGSQTDMLERVKFGGTISARWDLGAGVVAFIWDLLQNSGPRKTGRYRASVRLFVDGRETRDPQTAIGAKEALFVAGVPYARKIERGKKGYAPGKVYEAVAQQASRRYGNVARIRFTYHATRAVTGSLSRAERRAVNDERQPAILVYLS